MGGFLLILGLGLLAMLGIEQRRRARRARLLLHTLWKAREALSRARDAASALGAVAEVLGDCVLVRFAWVGQAEENGRVVPVAGSRSFPRDFPGLSWNDGPEGQGVTGRSIRLSQTLVCPDVLADPRCAPWRDFARRHRLRSAAATPVRKHGQRWGVLVLYGGEFQVLDRDLAELLESLGESLGHRLGEFELQERLEDNYHHLSLAMRIAHLGLWSWSPETGLEWLDDHELGRELAGGLHKNDQARFEAALRANVPGQGLVRAGGKHYKYWMEPGARGMVGVMQDVTRTSKVLQDLRRRDARFRVALAESSVTVFELDEQLRFSWLEHSRPPYAREEVLGKNVLEINGEAALPLHHAMEEVLRTGQSRKVSLVLRDHHYEISLEARHDEEGHVVGLLGSSIDLTDLRRAEDKARTLAQAVEQGRLPFMVCGEDGRIEYCNPQFYSISGFSESECVGLRPCELLSFEPEPIYSTLQSGQTWSGELLVKRKSGQQAWEWVSISPVIDQDGKIRKFVSVSQDISHEKEAEAALEETRRELGQAQKLEAVGRLAGGIAHDFNNLLANITGNCEHVRGQLQDGPLASALEEALGAARRGAALTRQLLAFGRGHKADTEWIRLNQELRALKTTVENRLNSTVTLEWQLTEAELEVGMDPTLLEICLKQLVDNAVQAMPEGGSLTIRTREAEERAVLEVSDTGSGMPPEVQARIFEPFYSTRQRRGLGLATVYGIVSQMGGELEVESSPGQGTTMRLRLVSRPGDQAGGPVARPASTRILLVEDQGDLLKLFGMLLERKGYHVEQAPTAEEALQHGAAFDLLLSDVSLPGMDGYNLARRLRAENPNLRVVMMSGYTDDAGSNEFVLVNKPFTPDELFRYVSEAFLRPPGE